MEAGDKSATGSVNLFFRTFRVVSGPGGLPQITPTLSGR